VYSRAGPNARGGAPVERSGHAVSRQAPRGCRPVRRGLAISRTGRGGLAYYALWNRDCA
jgi:hypothetical protein